MSNNIGSIIKKHKQIVLYAVFGVLTTAVDFAVSFILYNVTNVHVANVIAWIAAVIFAYAVNKVWVFESKSTGILFMLSEFVAFCSGRVLSLLLQEGIVVVFVDLLSLNKMAVKITAAVIVVVVNYILTKLVFKNGAKK